MVPSDLLATVVIPTRNRCDLLRQAVESVQAQSLPAGRIVVVDDASSDGTRAWLDRHRAVVAVHLEAKQGLPAARNAGLDEVETPLVLFLDDDDLLVPDALERLTRALDWHPDALAAVGGRIVFDREGRRRSERPVFARTLRDVHREVLLGWNAFNGTTLFRLKAFNLAGRWDPAYDRVAEDQELWLRLSHAGPVLVLPHIVLLNRVHAGQRRPPDVRVVEQQIRLRHIDAHSPTDAQEERALLRAWALRLAAAEAHKAGESRKAVAHFRDAVVNAPVLMTSPLLARSSWSLGCRVIVARLLGATAQERIRAVMRARRRWLRRDPGL
jgi:GT2 family glycosyltransferase